MSEIVRKHGKKRSIDSERAHELMEKILGVRSATIQFALARPGDLAVTFLEDDWLELSDGLNMNACQADATIYLPVKDMVKDFIDNADHASLMVLRETLVQALEQIAIAGSERVR